MTITISDHERYTIQDPVHGGIRFGPIEKAIIDHRLFQRLHGLRQNSLLHLVFPAANHTRFDHSVGVMHLAGRFLESILKNQLEIISKRKSRDTYQADYRVDDESIVQAVTQLSESDYPKIVLRAAALLHDTGHGPLSHLFEDFFPPLSFIQKLTETPTYEHIAQILSRESSTNDRIKHETLSCIIATRILSDLRSALIPFHIDSTEFAQDVCAVIDNKFQPSKRFTGYPYQVSHLLHEILSSKIDADRMDYLLRDSQMCGVNYGLYDPDRILKSMCAYASEKTKMMHVAVRYSGLGALEDLLLSRYQMHSQIYGHKTNCACAAMLDEIRGRLATAGWEWYNHCLTLEEFLQTFCGLDDSSLAAKLRKEPDVTSLLDQLIERRLVKRVFEERVVHSDKPCAEEAATIVRWEAHKRNLKENAIYYKEDVFDIKGVGVNGPDQKLKVLRKHPQNGYYMVHELGTLSTVAKYLPEQERIYRIYCNEADADRAKKLVPNPS